jgi:P3 major capsid protein
MPAANSNAGSPTTGANASNSYAQLYQQNMQTRNLIVHGVPSQGIPPAVDMWQPLNPVLPSGAGFGSVLTCQLRNVGLVKRLVLKLTGTITSTTDALTLTPLGLSNALSNVTFTDLANNQRINTTGWHLVAVSTAKRRRIWGAALTSDTPFGYGNNFSAVSAANIAANSAGNFTVFYEVPFVRNDHDLRGLIMGAVATATMQVSATLNPNFVVASGADPTGAVYQSSAAVLGTLSNLTFQVYQNYLDQYPRQQNGAPILPNLDIGTAYVLTQTSSVTPIANQDNAFPFVNQRQFLSTVAIYDNAGTLNVGSDITSWKLASANYTNITYTDPIMQALMGRVRIGDDFPKGMYYFDFNDRPIDTSVFGNMQLLLNPSNVGGSTAVVLLGWEAYGIIGQINQGGSIPSGA